MRSDLSGVYKGAWVEHFYLGMKAVIDCEV